MNKPYPDAPRTDDGDTLHGVRVPDPYRWLEDLDAAETRTWIDAQIRVTFDLLNQIPARDTIRRRISELWNYEKYGIPFRRGNRYFITRQDGLQNQDVLYWMPALDADPALLLDPNTLSEDGTVALTGYAVSNDGRYLAYGLSEAGSDWQTWRVREIDTARDLDDRLEWVKFSGASWTLDGQGFFYSRYDAPEEGKAYKGANYFHKLYYHALGTAQDKDTCIYERPDQKEWGFGGRVTEDGHTLIIQVWRGTHRENGLFYKDLRNPDAEIVELLNTFDADYRFLGNDGSRFFILTDLDAPMYRVLAIDLKRPEREHWQDIIPESTDVLEDISLVHNTFIVTYLHDACSNIKTFDTGGRPTNDIPLPGIGTAALGGGRRDSTEAFYFFTGFTTPGTIYRYDLKSARSTVFKTPAVDFNPEDYVTRQVFYPSKDGTKIPMFISHKKGLKHSADTPAYLYGYGGFNISQTPAFSIANLVWMEMGGIYAQASLRGGSEYGKAWHDGGRLQNKQNCFDDFIAGAEWLIENGYTSTPKLAIGGGSNGGLLVGACLTQRPDLFGACLPAVGVLDMLRFHKFTIGWAWTSDYGSPDEPEAFETLRAYSPYHNIKSGTAYPPILITTGDHDDRVFPAHSFKFAAALQHAQTGPAPTLIRIETRAGHGAGKPTAKLIEEFADRWAFLVHTFNMENDDESAN